ncbi:MAG: glycosyltransferase family 2 protein [Xenococcaceae cyanobacterium]
MEVSVIITTRDRPQQLSQACQSVFSQTIKPQEIIIVDDGSKITLDRLSLEQLCPQEISLKIERLNSSQGACVARNKGAEIARSDLLMFLDDDDTWEENKIKDQLEVLANHPNLDLVYSGKLIVSSEDREKILYRVKPKAWGKLYPHILYSNLIGTTSSVAIKKKFFQETGGFDEKMPSLQDYDLWIRVCRSGLVGHDRSCNVRYTVSTKSERQISGQSQRHIQAVKLILDKYSQEIKEQGLLKSRHIKSSMIWYVAKSIRRKGLITALPWIIQSFLLYPNLKILGLILPVTVIQKLRKSL